MDTLEQRALDMAYDLGIDNDIVEFVEESLYELVEPPIRMNVNYIVELDQRDLFVSIHPDDEQHTNAVLEYVSEELEQSKFNDMLFTLSDKIDVDNWNEIDVSINVQELMINRVIVSANLED